MTGAYGFTRSTRRLDGVAPLDDALRMDSAHLSGLLEVAGVDKEGPWSVVKDDRTLTLHAAQAGVGLNVTKLRKVRLQGELLYAENAHGDTFVLPLAVIFAGSVDPPSKASRQAGFR